MPTGESDEQLMGRPRVLEAQHQKALGNQGIRGPTLRDLILNDIYKQLH